MFSLNGFNPNLNNPKRRKTVNNEKLMCLSPDISVTKSSMAPINRQKYLNLMGLIFKYLVYVWATSVKISTPISKGFMR